MVAEPDVVAEPEVVALRDRPSAAATPAVPAADPTGLELARALAGDLSERAESGSRRWSPSRERMAGRAAAAGLPAPAGPGAERSPRPASRRRATPRAVGRVGGLASSAPFTGPGPGRDDPAPLAVEVASLVDHFGGRSRLAVLSLFADWATLVGADVAAHSRPVAFADGVLSVAADSSAWATQLRLLEPALRDAVDRLLGAGTVARVAVSGPARPSWRHGAWGLRDARGPRDTYG